MNAKLQALKEEINRQMPRVWIEDGVEFSARHGNCLWTGEGSTIELNDGTLVEAFDYYAATNLYEMGVWHELAEFLRKRGFYCEFYDAGTVMIYEV